MLDFVTKISPTALRRMARRSAAVALATAGVATAGVALAPAISQGAPVATSPAPVSGAPAAAGQAILSNLKTLSRWAYPQAAAAAHQPPRRVRASSVICIS